MAQFVNDDVEIDNIDVARYCRKSYVLIVGINAVQRELRPVCQSLSKELVYGC